MRFELEDQTDSVGATVSSKPKAVDTLSYYLARYSIEGEFQGYQELKAQLSVCPMTYSDVVKMKRFGVVTRNPCQFEVI